MAITTNVGKILMMPKGQWLNNVTYYYLDLVTYNGTKWLCKKESCIGMEPSNGSEYWYPWDEADVGGSVVDFTVATTRTDIQPGETIAILFGKIKKWLIDLKTVAFTGKMEDMVELTKASTTELGCVKVDGDTITVDENGVIKGNSKVTVDNQLSTTSENPVMNRVITAKINELEEEIGSGDAIIAENYSATTSYVANDEVIYNGELWRCKLACVGTTPAEGTYWTKTTVGNELKTINSDLSELGKSIVRVPKSSTLLKEFTNITGNTNSTYTIPSNGVYYLWIMQNTSTASNSRIYINGIRIMHRYDNVQYAQWDIPIYLEEGDVIIFSSQTTYNAQVHKWSYE